MRDLELIGDDLVIDGQVVASVAAGVSGSLRAHLENQIASCDAGALHDAWRDGHVEGYLQGRAAEREAQPLGREEAEQVRRYQLAITDAARRAAELASAAQPAAD